MGVTSCMFLSPKPWIACIITTYLDSCKGLQIFVLFKVYAWPVCAKRAQLEGREHRQNWMVCACAASNWSLLEALLESTSFWQSDFGGCGEWFEHEISLLEIFGENETRGWVQYQTQTPSVKELRRIYDIPNQTRQLKSSWELWGSVAKHAVRPGFGFCNKSPSQSGDRKASLTFVSVHFHGGRKNPPKALLNCIRRIVPHSTREHWHALTSMRKTCSSQCWAPFFGVMAITMEIACKERESWFPPLKTKLAAFS